QRGRRRRGGDGGRRGHRHGRRRGAQGQAARAERLGARVRLRARRLAAQARAHGVRGGLRHVALQLRRALGPAPRPQPRRRLLAVPGQRAERHGEVRPVPGVGGALLRGQPQLGDLRRVLARVRAGGRRHQRSGRRAVARRPDPQRHARPARRRPTVRRRPAVRSRDAPRLRRPAGRPGVAGQLQLLLHSPAPHRRHERREPHGRPDLRPVPERPDRVRAVLGRPDHLRAAVRRWDAAAGRGPERPHHHRRRPALPHARDHDAAVEHQLRDHAEVGGPVEHDVRLPEPRVRLARGVAPARAARLERDLRVHAGAERQLRLQLLHRAQGAAGSEVQLRPAEHPRPRVELL
ncbi:MAG: hypothetical protein AVDCRST_MAG11-343, partial [uncultured Gemmatimonadaceae bacterium]